MQLSGPYQTYDYHFDVLNPDDPMPRRHVVSPLSPAQVEAVAKDGYALLRSFVDPQLVRAFGEIVDSIRRSVYGNSNGDTYGSGRFGGQYIRDLHAVDWAAWPLLLESGIPDLVRSLLGPRLVLRSYSARITHPDSESSTIWHADQRARVVPTPPWSSDAPSATVIVYLDAADAESGRTELVPGSHTRWQLPVEDALGPEDRGAVVTVDGRPGDLIVFHGALWHRAGPTYAGPRRILNLQFAPSWSRRSLFTTEPAEPAWRRAADDALVAGRSDELELLGLGGYM